MSNIFFSNIILPLTSIADSIKEIETGWFTFLSTNGIQFGNLVLDPVVVTAQ